MKKYERITALITALAGAWIMVYAWRTLKLGSIHVPDAGLLPFLCGLGLVILGIVWLLILQWTAEPKEEKATEERRWQRPVLSLLLMVIYGVAMENLGYVTSTLLFVVAWEKLVEHETWIKTIFIACLGTLAMYALFIYFLKVPIPEELFLR